MVGGCVAGGICGSETCIAGGRVHGRGACVVGGGACMAGEMAIAVGGMHPTGMHSCSLNIVGKIDHRTLVVGGVDSLAPHNTHHSEELFL